MAEKKIIEIEARVGKAEKELEGVAKTAQNIDKNLEDVKKTTGGVAKGFKGIGLAIKAAGIGFAVAAFKKLVEVFQQNQKVVNVFNTAFEAVSLLFNDFFNFLDRNVGTVIDYFKGLFENPVQSIQNFGQAIVNNIVERVKSALDALGFLGDAVVKVFQGDFAGAAESAKSAGKELFDVVTGVNNTFDKVAETVPTVVKGITDYTISTIKAAAETVELNRAAEVGIAQNRIILEQKDREAEKLRQIRDDESKTIAERIEANNKLAAVLDEQEKLMLANADAVIKAAQAQFEKNGNDENQIALLEAKAEREGILAQIEGFRSEQLINVNSLERERIDLLDEEKEKAIENAELKAELRQEEREGIKNNLDAIIDAAGQETEIGRAVFIAKQAMLIKEQINEAKATLERITLRAAEAQVDTAKGASATARVGFPQNIPLLIAFAAQAAGIISSVKSAVAATKSAASAVGFSGGFSGGGISTPRGASVATSQAPAFNIVGASPENQLAQAIGEREQQPVKAFVVSNEVTNAQALDRNIVQSASLG
tara:strand:+ start:4747 stop:6369 length:1623 start_codon:yes stop_codon:yes gene_type:complete